MSVSTSRSGPARRAVLRWAWRLFRREWRQQVLVLALLTVAVAAAVAGASVAVNAASPYVGQFGKAKAIVRVDASDPAAAQASVAAARRRFGNLEVVGHAPAAVPGSPRTLDLRAQDPSGRLGRPMLALRSGRYPAAADEVALTDGAAELLAAGIGDRVRLGGVQRTVVGRVENPSDLDDEFALAAPGQVATAKTLTLLVASRPTPGTAAQSGGPSFGILVHGDDDAAVVPLVLVATTLALSLVCLVAAAGFLVVAQRHQRQLGLLAALGASQRHLRLVTVADGAIVGTLAAVAGGVLGVVGWVIAAPAVESVAGHRIGRFDLPWTLIAECLVLAVAVSTAAAWWPARTMARLPVMAALSRRPSPPAPVHRSLVLAVALVAAGVGAIAAAHPTAEHVRPLVLMGGLVMLVVGVVLVSPAAVRALGAPAGRLPFAARLAVRDLVRYQARAAAALAAITLGLGISVAVVVLAQASEPRSDEGNLSSRQLVVRVGGDPRTAPDPSLSEAARARLDDAAAQVAATVGHPEVLALDVVVNPAGTANVREPVSTAEVVGPHSFRDRGLPYVATASLLRHYGIDPASVGEGTELLTSLPEDVVLLDTSVRADPSEGPTAVQRVGLPTYGSAPNSLVTGTALQRHGWVRARAGWLVESPTSLTGDEVRAARAAGAAAGLTVEARDQRDDLAALRSGATAVGVLLALAIVGMTIGLIRGEATGDLRTLTATGAEARTRRMLSAGTAAALAVLGVVLGTSGAYVALAAGYHADLAKLGSPPVAHLALIVVGLPLVASAAGWLLAGREPPAFARQALD